MTQPSIIEVPAHQNILQYTVDFIFKTFSEDAPDFSNIFVFLPHAQVTQSFNYTLCQTTNSKLPAIIPPWAGTLKSWASKHSQPQNINFPVIGEYARQLLFIEALQQFPNLFKEENKWQVTQELLKLFDELSLNQVNIFTSPEKWHEQLQQAYGLSTEHQHLIAESKLVHTLWFAWQQQLNDSELYDETSDYLSRLSNANTSQKQFVCLGISNYSKAEQDFIQQLTNNKQCHVINFEKTMSVNNTNHGHTFSEFIYDAYKQPDETNNHFPLKQRAELFRNKHKDLSTKDLPFSTYLAANEEAQIRAIDYHVRLKVLDGNNNIAIISEDRKLSRRLRALLERANIQLQDNAGWSLATTQAATIIERWLECIEEDFGAYPLIDCLKSPFISISQKLFDDHSNDEYEEAIYRFEHDLVFHENVSAGINNYKEKLNDRLQRLSHWPENAYDKLISTLNYIEKTASPLSTLYLSNKNIQLSDFLNRLIKSLESLGVLNCYQNDEAGLVLLKTLEDLQHSITFSNPKLSWYDCRVWLGIALEQQHFTPPTNNSIVKLMTLEQSSYLTFDSIIIAATESQHFPGSANTSPFFNQAVRESLKLGTWKQQRQQRHETFNRTLLSAPEILFTACNEEKGEEKSVSPWLELLINFYQLCYGETPDNTYLSQLVKTGSEVFNCDEKNLPEPSIQPSPTIPNSLIPERVSASSYQRIINCPYQYFSADGLQLKPLEEISDELKKSDYGERIHLILQIFHSGKKSYGEAFNQEVTEDNRKQAEIYLEKISKDIFLGDIEENVLHRSWLYRWQKHISAYIDWQIRHQQDWKIYLSEEHLATPLTDSLEIYGRIDRIDVNKEDKTHIIIDYKTGKTAHQDDVDNGENVQLSTYALLDNQASDVCYLSVDSSDQKVAKKSSLSGDDLQTNKDENKRRLLSLFEQMKDNESLTAWGDDTVCGYCNFSGLCRKAEWTK